MTAALLTVLLVEDDSALARLIRVALLSEGFKVVTARDGIEGLLLLESSAVDAVVLDLHMPRMDGRSFYREMRSRGHLAPVVILSAYGAQAARLELGAESAMSKPFDPERLVREVRRLVGQSSGIASLGLDGLLTSQQRATDSTL